MSTFGCIICLLYMKFAKILRISYFKKLKGNFRTKIYNDQNKNLLDGLSREWQRRKKRSAKLKVSQQK